MRMGQKKTMSLKQLLANRNNGCLSIGPVTEKGKSISRMNATKHAILSKEVVVRSLRIRENSREFQSLRERYFEELAPEGTMEEMLVDRIVTNHWRLRRAITAETGEIALSVDNSYCGATNPTNADLASDFVGVGDVVVRMQDTLHGVRYLTHILKRLDKEVQSAGELTEQALKEVVAALGDKPNVWTTKLARLRAMLTANPEGLQANALKATHLEKVRAFISDEMVICRFQESSLDAREEVREEASQSAAVLPSAETLDKILRYETTLERQMYRAMHQLERLQRLRNGETVPPPMMMELTDRM